MEEENVKSLAEYLEVLSRRRGLILVCFLLTGFLGFVVAMKLPPVYRSSAVILIEDQQIPRSMIESTITDFADKRIELIKQRVMTRDRILSVIEKHHLYADERNKLLLSELVTRFQEDTEIRTIAANVFDPQRGGNKSTIAFTIAFSSEIPKLAQAVANELVSLFLDENTRFRAQRAAKTTEFMNEEAEKLKTEIRDAEENIAAYKEKHVKSLPEMLTANMSALDRTSETQRKVENDIRIIRDRIIYLTDAIRLSEEEEPEFKPGKALSKEDQIKLLKAQYIQVSSRYTAKHPDAIRVKRQLQNLDPSFTGESDLQSLQQELEKAETDLLLTTERYSLSHPDTVKLQKTVDTLKAKIKEADEAGVSVGEADNDNLKYVTLISQLRSAEHELEHLLTRQQELNETTKTLQEYVDKTPLVEKEYQELIRAREVSLRKYADLEAKYREAKLAQTLEEEQKGESFSLVEPPIAPDKPDKPDRKKIVALGMGAGLGLGLALTVLLELLQQVIRGGKALERVAGMPPLVVIPYIENPHDIDRRIKRKKRAWMFVSAVLILTVVLTHFLVMPLDTIWATIMLKLGRL